ncbi:MAG: HEAT repeat domain-containing protein [Planctomycetota bacterium]|jgi:HEAT repeat protein
MSVDSQDNMVDELIAKIRGGSDQVRTQAWLSASEIGAAAVRPLAGLMAEEEPEIALAAKRGLWKVVRYVGRPGADGQKKAAVAELIWLLAHGQPVTVRREVVWMLSEIGGDESVDPIAALLSNAELREDARAALERVPGRKSLSALKTALKEAHDDFKPNLAQSLRRRGVEVRGIECVKLVPTKQTSVKPIGSQ